jgi:hypothetical protein
MQTDLARYLPGFYDGVRETSELMRVENGLFDDLKDQTQITLDNQFILTCDAHMLSLWEGILQITFNSDIDTEAFRRDRIINRLASRSAFTLWFLRERLDAILGRDNYYLAMRHNDYELHVETAVDNQSLFNELILTVYRIKPANILFILTPVLRDRLAIKAKAYMANVDYKRAGVWRVGATRIIETNSEEEVPIW